MRAVNLLPRDLARQARKAPNAVLLVLVMGGLVVGFAVALAVITTSGTVAQTREEVELARVELGATPRPPEPPSAEEQGLADQRNQRATALGTALAGRIAWDRVLRRFSLVLPDDVWLTSLAAAAPAQAAAAQPGTATGFTITGFTYSHDGVARLLSRLEVIPDLTNVQLQRSVRSELAGREVVGFTIAADVRGGPAA